MPYVAKPAEGMTAAAAARLIGCSPATVQRFAICGRIKAVVEPGRTVRYVAEDVRRVAEERGVALTPLSGE